MKLRFYLWRLRYRNPSGRVYGIGFWKKKPTGWICATWLATCWDWAATESRWTSWRATASAERCWPNSDRSWDCKSICRKDPTPISVRKLERKSNSWCRASNHRTGNWNWRPLSVVRRWPDPIAACSGSCRPLRRRWARCAEDPKSAKGWWTSTASLSNWTAVRDECLPTRWRAAEPLPKRHPPDYVPGTGTLPNLASPCSKAPIPIAIHRCESGFWSVR